MLQYLNRYGESKRRPDRLQAVFYVRQTCYTCSIFLYRNFIMHYAWNSWERTLFSSSVNHRFINPYKELKHSTEIRKQFEFLNLLFLIFLNLLKKVNVYLKSVICTERKVFYERVCNLNLEPNLSFKLLYWEEGKFQK